MADIEITRHPAAARCPFSGRVLHDLVEYAVRSPWAAPRPAGVPARAQRHRGHLDADGRQVVVWQSVERRPAA